MNRLLTTLSLLVMCAWASAADDTNGARPEYEREDSRSPRSFEAYRSVTARNIFDATRRAWRPSAPSDPLPVEEAPPPAETITLVGTLIRQDGEGRERVAFFLGSEPGYATTAEQGDAVGDLRVVDITTSGTLLEAGDARISLQVGAALSRQSGENWEPSKRPADQMGASPTASGGTDGGDTEVDDILRRMLERRKEEIEQ